MSIARFTRKALVAAAFVGLAASSFSTQAALINGLLGGGVNEFQDTDAERILGATGGAVTSGNFAAGQVIQAILRFDTVNVTTIADVLPGYQMTAFSELGIAAVVNPTTNAACAATDASCRLVFSPAGNLGAGVFASIHERSPVNWSLAVSPDGPIAPGTGGIARATSGGLIATLGLGEPDDFWFADIVNPQAGDTTVIPGTGGQTLGSFAGNQIGLLAVLSQSAPQVANGVFGLTFLSNPAGLPVAPNGMEGADGNLHDVIGNASAYGRSPGVNTGWLVSSNTAAQFRVVPEPGSLALIGLVAVGLGLFGIGRKRV